MRVTSSDIKTVENKATVFLNNRTLAFVGLADMLSIGVKEKKKDEGALYLAVVLQSGEKRIAFKVEEIVSEQEVLVKNLGRQLSRVRNIAGAAVLGSGAVVPVIDVQDLFKTAVKASRDFATPATATEETYVKRKAILVVEDSITSRMLLKNIIESAGYNVKTAVDGIDALTYLKTEQFDLVVSDVEMPRMNGFDLTARMRQDEKLASIPLILVTSLESQEHKERGVEAGANAYIVKSHFNHTGLIEVIQRLI